jgi:hypothetical protein
MAEENLLETVPETPFINSEEDTEIPDMIDPELFTTPIPVDQAESEASGNNTPEESDGLAKLINDEIAEDIAPAPVTAKLESDLTANHTRALRITPILLNLTPYPEEVRAAMTMMTMMMMVTMVTMMMMMTAIAAEQWSVLMTMT